MCSKVAVLVPSCLLASGLQVSTSSTLNLWRDQYIHLFMKYNIDIVPYECSESSFNGYSSGLKRKPHGIDYYQSLNGYNEHCQLLAEKTSEQVYSMINVGYIFAAIIGIEHSPSCAINYMYSHQGMQHRPGLFISALKNDLSKKVATIPYVGINRKFPRKSLDELERYLINNKTLSPMS